MVNWDADELRVTFEAAGLVVEVITERTLTNIVAACKPLSSDMGVSGRRFYSP
jgi:hypothetical protein